MYDDDLTLHSDRRNVKVMIERKHHLLFVNQNSPPSSSHHSDGLLVRPIGICRDQNSHLEDPTQACSWHFANGQVPSQFGRDMPHHGAWGDV